MGVVVVSVIYLMFFLSGAAALMYEVVWVRSLSLIFGGTHLAVTTVLAVFMGGLALGSAVIGRFVDRVRKPLKLYGYLEVGIALSALAFIALMQTYPSVYSYLAEGKDSHRVYLTVVRVVFAVLALIVPTTLMGGTLPVLTRFASKHPSKMGTQLSLLYGFNTLGAVAGTATAGFFLLRYYSVSTTLHTAIIMNFLIGFVSLLLSSRASAMADQATQTSDGVEERRDDRLQSISGADHEHTDSLSARMILYGIGISGFCALGYEVLWTRILTLTIGTSVYGFTIMLVAFLTGIALGSEAYGLLLKLRPSVTHTVRSHILGFGIVQIIIGAAALLVTIHIRDLPIHSLSLNAFYYSRGMSTFHARQLANVTLAFSYMLVPSFFMGLAFPLAGTVISDYRKHIGQAVGSVLAYNTVGAIFGSAASGFILIYLFGIERSLQMLTVINIGFGLIVLFSIGNNRLMMRTLGGLMVASVMFLAINHDAFRMWDTDFLAIFQNNRPEAYDTPEKRRDAIENTDRLFYHEGINSTISAIKVKGADQAVLVNGKVVASSSLRDQQCQLTLGHLPMLLHPNPRKVLVVGLGTGITLGATSVYPGVDDLTLAEIEPNVLGAARTFAAYNHAVLDNPKLKIIFNDGRNYLMTTKNKYDVITADPIHPWTQGSGYLYTAEYFKIAAEHLLPGGIMCQWLPIYELSAADLRSVVRTFSLNFKYTMTWLTQYDAELIGSNSPLMINEKELERRIADPRILGDLRRVMMGSATDFLSYFIMGTDGMREFSRGGVINTDDNLYLEFTTPVSAGVNVMRYNVNALSRHRENILPYLVPAPAGRPREEQIMRWRVNGEAAAIHDLAHGLFLGVHYDEPNFQALMAELDTKYPDFAPGRFLKKEYLTEQSRVPYLLEQMPFTLLNEKGERVVVEIAAVVTRVSEERAAVLFVDNAARVIYGQRYFSGPDFDPTMKAFVRGVFAALKAMYRAEGDAARKLGRTYPSAAPTMQKIQDVITTKVKVNTGT
jgi:spermidine synthase